MANLNQIGFESHPCRSAKQYKYTSTKEYHDSFPCAYRQWRADSHCNMIHGYSFSMKFYFGTDELDVRNWAADYGGLKELKSQRSTSANFQWLFSVYTGRSQAQRISLIMIWTSQTGC